MIQGMITEALLRELLTESEEMAEQWRDAYVAHRGYGDDDACLLYLKYERQTRSVIRRARHVLRTMLES